MYVDHGYIVAYVSSLTCLLRSESRPDLHGED